MFMFKLNTWKENLYISYHFNLENILGKEVRSNFERNMAAEFSTKAKYLEILPSLNCKYLGLELLGFKNVKVYHNLQLKTYPELSLDRL